MITKIKRTIKKVYRSPLQFFFRLFGSSVQCNICGYLTNRFTSDQWHLYSICQSCGSSIRHRLIWASIEHLEDFSAEKLLLDKRIIHFAPESYLQKKIIKFSNKYLTADFFSDGYFYEHIDLRISISDMQSIPDNSIDCLIAIDVLEHVAQDRKALGEIKRILKKSGYCILSVPQKDNLEITEEDTSLTDSKTREQRFGQFDHLRIYGNDFKERLEEVGFAVSVVDKSSFEESLVNRHVLFPPVLSTLPLATNFRKIYFGMKM